MTRYFQLLYASICTYFFFQSCSSQFLHSNLYQNTSTNPRVSILDISLKTNLEFVVNEKAFRSELILFAFSSTWPWLDWAAAMHTQLITIGYQHHIALAISVDDCKRLHERAPLAACVTYTLPGIHWEHERSGIDYMWIARYKLANEIVRLTNTSVLVIDLDCFFQRDIYVDLHTEPHSKAQLIHMEEGWANGGVFYVRNTAHLNGPALWIHDEVWRRADAIKRLVHSPGGFSGTAMDQALMNDALNAAATNGSVHDWPSTYVTGEAHHRHPFWKEHNRGNISSRPPGTKWYASDWSYEEVEVSIPMPTNLTSQQLERFQNFQGIHKRTRFKYMPIRIPADDPTAGSDKTVSETFAAGLPLTMSNYQTAQYGWSVSAVVHLVAASADFGDAGEWTHSGRRAIMASAGAWDVTPADDVLYVGVAPHTIQTIDYSSKDSIIQTLRRLIYTAASLSRAPVIFGVPCDRLTWVGRSTLSRDAVLDKRFVVRDGLCYPAPGGPNCWHDSFAYSFEVHERAVPLLTVDDAQGLNRTRYVTVRQLPGEQAALQRCPRW